MHVPIRHELLFTDRRPARVGRRVILCDEVASTNDEAWSYLNEPDADGLAVFAEYQTRGRGRMGRRWESPPGASVMCSVLLIERSADPSVASQLADPAQGRIDPTDPKVAPLEHSVPVNQDWPNGVVGLVAAIACHDAIVNVAQIDCTIQWPNDLVVREKKLAGILVESRSRGSRGSAYVIGLGINCLQRRDQFEPVLRDRATSLLLECPQAIARHTVAQSLLAEMDRWFGYARPNDVAAIRDAWLRRSAPLGRRVRLLHGGNEYSGRMIDIDPLATLVVQLDTGARRTFSADETTVLNYGDS